MGLRINTNVASINAQRNLVKSTDALNQSLSRLSSGLRITKAADDAAGLAISETLRAQVRGLGVATRNANDGISLIQTAEGSLNETSGILVRMRELAVEASTGTLTDSQRGFLNDEFEALTSEITRIANATEFNGTTLLAGGLSATGISFQIGIDNVSTVDRISLTIGDASAGATGLNVDSLAISTSSGAQSAIDTLDAAIVSVADLRGDLGAVQNRLESVINNLGVSVENLSSAESRIRDVDIASETANLTRSQILQQAGVSVLAQANTSPQIALSLLK